MLWQLSRYQKRYIWRGFGLELRKINISENEKWTALPKDLGWVTAPCAMSLPVFVNICQGSPNSTEKRNCPSATSSIVRDP